MIPLSTIRAEELTHRGHELIEAACQAEAARAFRQALASDPACFAAYHGLIRALRDAGQMEQAIGAALALAAIAPADHTAHAALAVSLEAAGHRAEAQTAAARSRVLEWKASLNSERQEERQA